MILFRHLYTPFDSRNLANHTNMTNFLNNVFHQDFSHLGRVLVVSLRLIMELPRIPFDTILH